MTDEELRDRLRDIDDVADLISVTSWEAQFIESVVFEYEGPLSEKQRAVAEEIIEKYEGDLD